MSLEKLCKNRMACKSSPTPLEEASWIFAWFDLVLGLPKEQHLKAKYKNVKVW